MNRKSVIIIALIFMTVVCFGTVGVHAEESAHSGWQTDGYGRWYQLDDGSYFVSGWQYLDGTWYYFDDSGYVHTGWLSDGEWYYMNQDGGMAVGWVMDGYAWYYMDPGSGIMQTGWIWDGTGWYYLNEDGSRASGWIFDGSDWYYMRQGGTFVTGWFLYEGSWYYMNPDGSRASGWIFDGSDWYYLNQDGNIVTGWIKEGISWYYLAPDGVMVTGKYTIGDVEYEFNEDGTWIDPNPVVDLEPVYDGITLTEDIAEYMKSLVASVTTADMTREEKLWAVFSYIADRNVFPFAQNRIPYYREYDWPVVYAHDMMYLGASDCHGISALFGYAAVLCGYENVHWAQNGYHAWVDIDGLVYDPVFRDSANATLVYGWTYETAIANSDSLGAGYFYIYVMEGTYQFIKVPLF